MKQLHEMAIVRDDSFVLDVTDRRVEDALHFGGKASGLAKMARVGIPIAPAFVVGVDCARERSGREKLCPRHLAAVLAHVLRHRFGD
jgi:hypothetical protein